MYLYAAPTRQLMGGRRSLQRYMRDQYAVVLHREGVVTTTTVRDGLDGTRSLVINGKVDASDGSDMATQVLLAHIPLLLHHEPRDVAVIGLASGVTLGSAAQHPSVRSLECLEIAPETVEACRLFDHVNHRVLDDPRVRLVLADGRNHLTLTDRQYDVIVSEPSNPWIAGVANLFTQEFFAACRARLRPGGVAGIWLHLYGSSPEVMRNIARTFQAEFPAATLWESIFGADYLLVGSASDVAVEWNELARRLQVPAVAADLARVGIQGPPDFLLRHVASGDELQRWIGAGEVYRDDRNRLEFDAPRMMHSQLTPQDMQSIRDLARPHLPRWLRVPAGGLTAPDIAALTAAFRSRDDFWRGFVAEMRGDHVLSLAAYRSALHANPGIAVTMSVYVEDAARSAHAPMLARGDTLGFERSARELVQLQPALTGIRLELAKVLAARGQLDAAEAEYRAVLERRPRDPVTRLELAALLDRGGRRADAEVEVRRVLAERPGHAPALLSLGNYLVERGQLPEGEAQYRAALASDPEFPVAWYLLGNVLHMRGDHAEGARAAERAWRLDPGVPATRDLLAACYRALGEADKAAAVVAR
jgi:spermidine synthase/tetratricopeptide (TPR) repeat protein